MDQEFLKVQLRTGQTIHQIGQYDDHTVRICAPLWVKKGLQELDKHIPAGTLLQFSDADPKSKPQILEVKPKLRLKHLQMIARNEMSNGNGTIMFNLYSPLIQDKSVILAIKDLVRQCIIIGRDKTTHYGGYPPGTKIKEQRADVIVIDQIAFDFRQAAFQRNSSRLVLIGDRLDKGKLDDFIFENVVGEKKVSPQEAKKDRGRYAKYESKRGDVYFDTVAYQKFVEQDFLLVCFALNCINRNNRQFGVAVKNMSLKFLKYGTGIFAGTIWNDAIKENITRGISRAMRRFFESHLQNELRSFEFPFYEKDQEIIDLCAKHKMRWSFEKEDALKETAKPLVTATTNCANPHAMAGNTMNHGSVDAAIAENLESKANKFSPILNTKTKGRYFDMNQIDEEPQVAKIHDTKPGSKRAKRS